MEMQVNNRFIKWEYEYDYKVDRKKIRVIQIYLHTLFLIIW